MKILLFLFLSFPAVSQITFTSRPDLLLYIMKYDYTDQEIIRKTYDLDNSIITIDYDIEKDGYRFKFNTDIFYDDYICYVDRVIEKNHALLLRCREASTGRNAKIAWDDTFITLRTVDMDDSQKNHYYFFRISKKH